MEDLGVLKAAPTGASVAGLFLVGESPSSPLSAAPGPGGLVSGLARLSLLAV